MKHTLSVLLIFAALVQTEALNPTCFFKNLKVLFVPDKIDFVAKLLKETAGIPELHKLCVDMDRHGDKVLSRWARCTKCIMPPCRLPHITYLISATSEMMKKLIALNAKLSSHPGTNPRMVANCKRVIDKALLENQQARLCPP